VYSEHARKNLIREGIHSYTIIMTGSPMLEVLEKNKLKILKSPILKKLNIKKNEFFLISLHREENLDNDKIFD
jgi:UDP-N-acetylglucosamine 2-epimerase (non-hydrolysing)